MFPPPVKPVPAVTPVISPEAGSSQVISPVAAERAVKTNPSVGALLTLRLASSTTLFAITVSLLVEVTSPVKLPILVTVPAAPETDVTFEFSNVERLVKLVPPRATAKVPLAMLPALVVSVVADVANP